MTEIAGASEREVWTTVQALNRVWAIDGQPERLVDCFAPEMVAIAPTDERRLEGREACVAGWTAFVRATKILRWHETNAVVLMLAADHSAVVAYDFDIAYEMNGHVVEMSGRDLMMLDRRDGRWLLVADHYSPSPG